MIPATGFLAEANNTNQNPELALLPTAESFTYSDGPESAIDTSIEETLGVTTKFYGGFSVDTVVGLANKQMKFSAIVNRLSTYAVLLVESILVPAPPATIETPAEPEFDKATCFNFVDLLSYEACCVADLGWLYNGAYKYDGSKKAGIP